MSYKNFLSKFRVSDGWAEHIARGSAGGIDYAVGVGTPIPAPCDGRLENIPNNGQGGHTANLHHADGSYDQFMHLSKFAQPGPHKQGDIIGYSGGAAGAAGAGSSTGPHVHWHLIRGGRRVNPLDYVDGATPNRDVAVFQELLNKCGYKLVVDNSYGPLSKAAVVDFQGKHGLEKDGVVGPKTLAALRAEVAKRAAAALLAKPVVAPVVVPEPVVAPVVVPDPVKSTPVIPEKPKEKPVATKARKEIKVEEINVDDTPTDVKGLTILKRQFWVYAGERVTKTVAQVLTAALTTNGAASLVGVNTVDWMYIVAVTVSAGVYSVATSLTAYTKK